MSSRRWPRVRRWPRYRWYVRATGRPVKANLDSGVLAAIDAEAARRKLTRSGLVELLARHGLTDLA